MTNNPTATPSKTTINTLRNYSRQLIRELGFMRPTLAGSDLTPSAVHALIEIGQQPKIHANDLAQLLRLDKSNTSRQLTKLESLGLITRNPDEVDARVMTLMLTEIGQQTLTKVDAFATQQIQNALRGFDDSAQQALIESLRQYVQALTHDNPNCNTQPITLGTHHFSEGYQPGCIGDIASLHARYYAEHSGFGVFFEHKVGTELGEFVEQLPQKGKNIWCYHEAGRTLASIVIDGNLDTRQAHLRWFIVDESLRGTGIGRALLTTALAYVDRYFSETYLWTFAGLNPARHLYESNGFILTEEATGNQWGREVTEQRFVRPAPTER